MTLALSEIKVLNYKSINDVTLNIKNKIIVIQRFLLGKMKLANLIYLMLLLLFLSLQKNLIMKN
ncbi:TPA: hypothetical protein CPU00_05445 [Candidatus Gastranaerophilales bacterium HUM_18]|nr:MAG TPA: hypothetical protein CPU00_05445 [Candidatus Gastranaerophilales bacterium HUM_18]